MTRSYGNSAHMSDDMVGETGQRKKPSFIPVQFSDTLTRSIVETSPLGRTLDFDLSQLPDIPAPPLDNLRVTLPPPAAVTEDELIDRFYELCYQQAQRTPRKPGELVEAGDELIVDIFGYAQGRMLPFSARGQFCTLAAPDPNLPGLFESLVGCPVGELQTVQIALPETYPREELQGVNAVFVVDIREATALELPNPEDPALLQTIGLGESLDATFDALMAKLTQEREDEWLEKATISVLEELVMRARIVVPTPLLADEIKQLWRAHEGTFLAQKGVDQEDLEASLGGWLSDMDLRMEVRKRISIALLLRSLAQSEAFNFDTEEFDGFIEEIAEQLNQKPAVLRKSLADDVSSRHQLLDKFLHLRAIQFVLSHVEF